VIIDFSNLLKCIIKLVDIMNLKFSVVTVTFNAEDKIRKTIESVLNQSYPPYEYLIIDGGSQDKTVYYSQQYKNDFYQRKIKYIIKSEPDQGIFNAMNKGIDAAEGDFISFINSGDWYEPDALENINNFYNAQPFDLTYGGLNYISPNGGSFIKMSRKDKHFVTSRHWNHPSMFLRREIYQGFKFDETFRYYADFELYLRLLKSGVNIEVIPKVITYFTADGISTDPDISKVFARSREKYNAYRKNGYSPLYWFESYGWEMLKTLILRLKR